MLPSGTRCAIMPLRSMGFFRLRNTLLRTRFGWATRDIFKTPPVSSSGGPIVLTMVSRQDLGIYLMAAKSFLLALGTGEPHVLDDGSLTASDHAQLSSHLPGLQIHSIAAIDTGGCPRGGCWERLSLALELARTRYVIQMDSDTLATGPVDEVKLAFEQNRAFALGTRSGGLAFKTLTETAEFARTISSGHVQPAAELVLGTLDRAAVRRYVRASAGFAGYAAGGFSFANLQAFSNEMEAALGGRWREWGTEQISSNYAVANMPDSTVLPWPRYACFSPDLPLPETSFLHFIGPTRFLAGVYMRLAGELIQRLSQDGR